MERKEKREFARTVAKLEMRISKAKTQEEKEAAEAAMENLIMANFEALKPEDVSYIDEFIMKKLDKRSTN
jgi:hypothetical protein